MRDKREASLPEQIFHAINDSIQVLTSINREIMERDCGMDEWELSHLLFCLGIRPGTQLIRKLEAKHRVHGGHLRLVSTGERLEDGSRDAR